MACGLWSWQSGTWWLALCRSMSVRAGHGAALHPQQLTAIALPLELLWRWWEISSVRAAEAWACLHGASQDFDLIPEVDTLNVHLIKNLAEAARGCKHKRKGAGQACRTLPNTVHPPVTSWIRGGLSFFNKSQGFFSPWTCAGLHFLLIVDPGIESHILTPSCIWTIQPISLCLLITCCLWTFESLIWRPCSKNSNSGVGRDCEQLHFAQPGFSTNNSYFILHIFFSS